MTTFPISAPPVSVAAEQIGLTQKYTAMSSPFSGAYVSTSLGFSQWHVEISFPPIHPTNMASAKAFMSWLDSLQGSRGYFTYQPFGSGVALTGKTLSSTANAMTNTINVGGWSASQATGLAAGDYLTISNQMFRIVSAPASANGSGIATLSIEPFVRLTISSGNTVNFQTPTVNLRVDAEDQSMAMSRDPEAIYLPTLKCIEAR